MQKLHDAVHRAGKAAKAKHQAEHENEIAEVKVLKITHHQAEREKAIAEILQILEQGVTINSPDENGLTAVSVAVLEDDLDLLRELFTDAALFIKTKKELSHPLFPNQKIPAGSNLADLAYEIGCEKVHAYLIQNGVLNKDFAAAAALTERKKREAELLGGAAAVPIAAAPRPAAAAAPRVVVPAVVQAAPPARALLAEKASVARASVAPNDCRIC